ncbi:hypothetical protein GHT06_017087 [Daphnia sinensis]|uniref:Uncharacterized protein n=1 Tax=Daphnia sinensis TaxID=1820382 RepID=A0AAD5PUM3_9CRUS|nr:hypothetical protein GHT06_017087 [Daphnia sinensis]
MHVKLDENPNGTTFLPMSEVVSRLSAFNQPGCDHVTIVFYNFISFTVKPKNLVSECHVERCLIRVVWECCKRKQGYCLCPFVVVGDEISRIIQGPQLTDWICTMKLACSPRMFPLCSGRNKVTIEYEDDEGASD